MIDQTGGIILDSTVQTVQEVGNQVSQYRQMFENYLPDITKFGIKVVLAIVAFWVGSTVINWIQEWHSLCPHWSRSYFTYS